MFRFLVVWGVGVERNGIDVGPRARHCGPALGMLLARQRIDPGTLLEQGAVQARVMLGWRHKADGTVTVLVVVRCGARRLRYVAAHHGSIWRQAGNDRFW